MSKDRFLTEAKWNEVKLLLLSGMKQSAVAEKCNVSTATVGRVNRASEFTKRRPRRTAPIGAHMEKKIKELLLGGMSGQKAAIVLDVPQKVAYAVRDKYNIAVLKNYANRLTPERTENIKRLLASGENTFQQITNTCNVSLSTISKIQKKYNIPPARNVHRLDAHSKAKIVEMLLAGRAIPEIQKQCKTTAATINKIRKRNNIPARYTKLPIQVGQEVTRLLERGWSIKKIMKTTGASRQAVLTRMTWDLGSLVNPKMQIVKQLLGNGMRIEEIAAQVGMRQSLLEMIIKENHRKRHSKGRMSNKQSRSLRKARHKWPRDAAARNTQKSRQSIAYLDEKPFIILI
ncbi:hypothetical protein BC940DRAFT_291061 [Gongronella butleri]|nr:hypothetical protein BC940DRAFT_291061 [Gongronella butleri]